jgi:hypothetical protein
MMAADLANRSPSAFDIPPMVGDFGSLARMYSYSFGLDLIGTYPIAHRIVRNPNLVLRIKFRVTKMGLKDEMGRS